MHLRHLHHLRYLQLVVERGSFARAAHDAGVSQPAITMAMQALERAWGVALFEKVGRRKVPTRAALAAVRRVAGMHERIASLPVPGAVAQAPSPDRGAASLRAGMAPAAALLYGAVVERAWRAHAPDGLLQLVSHPADEMLAALRAGDLDLVVAPRPRRHPSAGLKRLVLHTSTPTVYARAGHPLAGAGSLDEIAGAGWAVAGRAGTPGNVVEEAHRARRLPPPRVMVQCADYPALIELVAQSDLLCVVPHPSLIRQAGERRLQPLPIREGLPRYEVSLFWPPPGRASANAALPAVVAALRLAALGPARPGTPA